VTVPLEVNVVFDVTSGAVLRGPAKRPVRSRSVHAKGEDLLVEA